MRILCYDLNGESLFVLDVCAAYYDDEVNGLVLTPVYSSFDDFCFPDINKGYCDSIVWGLYKEGILDLRDMGPISMYSDIVKKDQA